MKNASALRSAAGLGSLVSWASCASLVFAIGGLAGCSGRTSTAREVSPEPAACPTCDPMVSADGGEGEDTGTGAGDAGSSFGAECKTTADCGSGGFCFYAIADGCKATGVCYYPQGVDCASEVLYCACDGTIAFTKGCNGQEGDYASAPIALPATSPGVRADGAPICSLDAGGE